jgi:hypothetical protein
MSHPAFHRVGQPDSRRPSLAGPRNFPLFYLEPYLLRAAFMYQLLFP